MGLRKWDPRIELQRQSALHGSGHSTAHGEEEMERRRPEREMREVKRERWEGDRWTFAIKADHGASFCSDIFQFYYFPKEPLGDHAGYTYHRSWPGQTCDTGRVFIPKQPNTPLVHFLPKGSKRPFPRSLISAEKGEVHQRLCRENWLFLIKLGDFFPWQLTKTAPTTTQWWKATKHCEL